MLKYICNDCGYKTKNLDTHLIYRKKGKIIETPYVNMYGLFKEHMESDVKGYVNFSYCEECNKLIKIYSGYKCNDISEDFDEENNNAEIKEYMKHKRSPYSIKIFVEDEEDTLLKCPKCNKGLSKVKKCLKCGSTNLFLDEIYD